MSLMHFDDLQIENIIDKVVPLIAEEKDHEFFRGVLFCKAQDSSSAVFSSFIAKLLKSTQVS